MRPGSDIPLVEALASDDAPAVLDNWLSDNLHESWTALRKRFRITWPCPCKACSPKPPRISVQPTGPTAFEVYRLVYESRLRGELLTLEKARAILIAEANGGSQPAVSTLHEPSTGGDDVPVPPTEART